MSSLEIQENSIYSQLQSGFLTQGYEPVSAGMEFRKVCENTSKSILFSLSKTEGQHILDLHLGIGFKVIQSLVGQFISDSELTVENYTIKATPHRFNRPPLQRFILTDETSIEIACRQIKEFMQKKGYRFLNTFDKLKRADAVINRKPHLNSLYLQNQVYRCFVGITLARLLQRTDFENLAVIYGNYLYTRKVPEKVTENFQKLLNYLKYFSFN